MGMTGAMGLRGVDGVTYALAAAFLMCMAIMG